MLGGEQAPNILPRQLSAGGKRRKSPTVDVAAIESLDRDDCIERWRQLFGVALPKYTSVEFMHKALAYEAQVKAFGGHSNAVQRALKASLKAVRSEVETDNSAERNFDAHAATASASCVEREGVVVRTAPNVHQTIQHNTGVPDACDQISIMSRGRITPSAITQARAKADSNTDASKVTKSTRSLTQPNRLS
jgi:hypothetical protein